MISTNKPKTDLPAYWFTLLLIVLIFSLFGMNLIEWIFMKLYEFFIQLNTSKT
jgi:hypothetical protein